MKVQFGGDGAFSSFLTSTSSPRVTLLVISISLVGWVAAWPQQLPLQQPHAAPLHRQSSFSPYSLCSSPRSSSKGVFKHPEKKERGINGEGRAGQSQKCRSIASSREGSSFWYLVSHLGSSCYCNCSSFIRQLQVCCIIPPPHLQQSSKLLLLPSADAETLFPSQF